MENLINSIKAHLYERTSSPVIGAFIFYWIVCNYKLVMILFDGDMKLNDKFDLIKTIYPQEKITIWTGFDIYYQIILGTGFLIPLLISLVYIFITPFPSKFIYKYWKEKQKEILEIKVNIDDNSPLTNEQSKKIRQDMIDLEMQYEDIIKRKDEQIIELKRNIEINTNKVKNTSNNDDISDNSTTKIISTKRPHYQVNKKMGSIIEAISESKLDKVEIGSKLKERLDFTEITHYLDELFALNYIDYDINEDKNKVYKITKLGRKYLVDNNLTKVSDS